MHFLLPMCFICLKSKIGLNVINKEILTKFLYFIDKPEGLTKPISDERKMCNDCLNELKAAFHFKKICLKNVLQFEIYIGQLEQTFNSFNPRKIRTTEVTEVSESKTALEVNEFVNSRLEHYSNEQSGTSFIKNEILDEVNFESYGSNEIEKTYLDQEVKRVSRNEEIVGEELKNKSTEMSSNDLINVNNHKITNKYSDSHLEQHSSEQVEKVSIKYESLEELHLQFYRDGDYQKQNSNEDQVEQLSNEDLTDVDEEVVELQSEKILKCDYVPAQESSKLVSTEGSPKNQSIFVCATCDRHFTLKSNLKRHVQQIHSNKKSLIISKKKPYTCATCMKNFKRKDTLDCHMLVHTKPRPHSCSVCKKSFIRKDHLKKHILIHSKERPYSCLICKKSFKRKDILDCHMLVHTKPRPHSCSVCKKSFIGQDHLNTHILIHSKKRPYSCLICKKSFKRKDTLDCHMLVHTKPRLYFCSICPKRFKTKSHVNQHIIIHTEQRLPSPVSVKNCSIKE